MFDVSGFSDGGGRHSDIDGLLGLLEGHVSAYVFVSSVMAYDQALNGCSRTDLPTNTDGPTS
ncbi:MAG: hypothetical protein R2705_20115 [Ilumatobacteraceae bacterium]